MDKEYIKKTEYKKQTTKACKRLWQYCSYNGEY